MPAASAPVQAVSTLLGHRHVPMAVACLASLLRYSAERLRLRIHDDGSLTPEDLDRLGAGLGGFELVPRREADERVGEALARHPALAAFRRGSPLALKLVDVVLLAGDGPLAYCDSDVLFLRPFSGLFRFPSPAAGALFMRDSQHAYSLRSWHLLRDRRLALPGRVNTGIVHFRTSGFDPDLLERYLARPEHRFAPVWVEQTAWALLGEAAGCWLLDGRQVAIADAAAPAGPESVALHFVSPVRSLLGPCLAALADRSGEAPVPIASSPARRCGPLALAATEARRRLRRIRTG